MKKTTAVLIVAGGSGTRMGSGIPKQFLPLGGKPVIVWTVEKFRETLPGAKIYVALPAGLHTIWREIAAEHGLEGACTVCTGGKTRFMTVRNALEVIELSDVVLVHDAVRPLVTRKVIQEVRKKAAACGACIPVISPVDSFREVKPDGGSVPVDRSTLRAVQTPQGFGYELLKTAYAQPYRETFTDDASVVEAYGHPVELCEGSVQNMKITYPQDIAIAETFIDLSAGSPGRRKEICRRKDGSFVYKERMEARFGYKRDKRCKWLTFVYILLILGVFAFLFFGMGNTYLRAWLAAISGAVFLLYILSIPRYVKVDDDYLEIHCTVEMTRIDVRDIVSIRKTNFNEYQNRYICLLGSYGFFGYYGYYFNYREWDFVKVYATERDNLVLLEDIYEQVYLISCREADRLIDTVMQAKLTHPGKTGEDR